MMHLRDGASLHIRNALKVLSFGIKKLALVYGIGSFEILQSILTISSVYLIETNGNVLMTMIVI